LKVAQNLYCCASAGIQWVYRCQRLSYARKNCFTWCRGSRSPRKTEDSETYVYCNANWGQHEVRACHSYSLLKRGRLLCSSTKLQWVGKTEVWKSQNTWLQSVVKHCVTS